MATIKKNVNIEQPVTIYPCQMRGATSFPIEGESYCLSPSEVKYFVTQLESMGKLELIEETLQGLSERLDGTLLLSAFPSIDNVKQCLKAGLMLPMPLLVKLEKWEGLGASEVNFDFVEAV